MSQPPGAVAGSPGDPSVPVPVTTRLAGWGNYPRVACRMITPPEVTDVAYAAGGLATVVPRGLGRSYGDAALNAAGVLDMTALEGIQSWDAETGVLRAEAGVSLHAIVTQFLAQGWFLPVTPGTWFVTLGGAVAADVHGKNHHVAGSFGRHVQSFTLLDGRGRTLTCTPTRNKEAFFATLGGMGLTGIILDVTLRLQRVESAFMRATTTKAANLDAALDAFAATDQDFTCSMAWIDCVAKGPRLGRSVLMQADHAAVTDLPEGSKTAAAPFEARPARRPGVPAYAPGFALNRASVGGFNRLYYQAAKAGERVQPLLPYFYPLDAIGHWNRLYGRRGFVQFQCVLPPATEREGLHAIVGHIAASGRSSPLAVLKRFGPGEPRSHLSFPIAGATLALDIPAKRGIRDFMAELDALVLQFGGRTYLAKDACMTAETVAAMYPGLPKWQRIRNRLDPEAKFSSLLGRRTGLVEAA